MINIKKFRRDVGIIFPTIKLALGVIRPLPSATAVKSFQSLNWRHFSVSAPYLGQHLPWIYCVETVMCYLSLEKTADYDTQAYMLKKYFENFGRKRNDDHISLNLKRSFFLDTNRNTDTISITAHPACDILYDI
jgi:hypothetical protein